MAAKVFDGLFLGDSATSMDADFLDLNKISRLINVAGRQLRNSLSGHGFVYKTYYWEDESDFLIFPAMERDKALLDMVEFIDASLRKGLSVLIYSDRGISRNAFAVCSFLMFKYHWGFEKSYDFVISKKRDIQINQGFVQQLFSLEKRLVTSRRKQLHLSDMPSDCDLVVRERLRRDEWDPNYLTCRSISSAPHTFSRAKVSEDTGRGSRSDELGDDVAEDELLLVNSYLNGMNTITVLPGPYRNVYEMQKAFKLRFNGLLLEEDVHVFPTSPPSRYNPPPTPKGILRGKKAAPPPPHHAAETGLSKNSSPDSSSDDAEAKSARNRPSNGHLPSPMSCLEGTAAGTSSPPSGSGSGPGSGPGSRPQKQWHNAALSDNPQTYSTSTHRDRSIEAKREKERERENVLLESSLINGWKGTGRREQDSPPDSLYRLPLSVSDGDSARYRDADASNSYSNTGVGVGMGAGMGVGRIHDDRSALTAEDCMRNIMTDLRASNTGEDEKSSRNSRNSSSGSSGSGNSSSSSSWNYQGSTGYPALRDEDYSDPSDRLLYRGGCADAKDTEIEKEKEREKEKDPYDDLGSLSLHDLAALPLHFEKATADRMDSKLDSSSMGKYYQSGPSSTAGQGFGDKYNADYAYEAYDAYSSSRHTSSSKRQTDSTEASSSSSSSSSKWASSNAYGATRSGSDEVERTDNPLSSFQRLGQEGAVRVQYSSLQLPPSASHPTKSPQNAWQGTANKEKERIPVPSSYSNSVRSTDFKHSNDPATGGWSELRAEREKEKEKEKEKPLRTYRHGSPAPFKVSSRILPTPQYPSSSSTTTLRARASSPSLVRRDGDRDRERDRERGFSPGRGSVAASSGDFDRFRLHHSRSADTPGSGLELAAEGGYTYSLKASSNNGRRNSGGGLGVGTPLKPASPGTRRGKGPVSDFSSSSSSSSRTRVPPRSATPVRGNWR